MSKALLSLHVLAAIVAIGPITVAASVFPRTLRTTDGGAAQLASLATLHRICRVYAAVAIAVPLLGIATAASMGVLGDVWLSASIALTALAGGVLIASLLPLQERSLRELRAGAQPSVERLRAEAARLAITTGLFNLLWATVVVLMVVRPGSTTGA